jgi:hypothetical protein
VVSNCFMTTAQNWKLETLWRIRALLIVFCFSAACLGQTVVEVQEVKELKPTGSLSTCGYAPSEQEKPFFDKLAPKERATGSFMQGYDIHKKNNQYVSWYGIVRGISKVSGEDAWQLLLEHKYFDGMTDCHIMLVSISGSGDFLAQAGGKDVSIPPLSLVRVYGTVKKDKDGTPVITAEFVRVWPWMTFTFTDLGGEDKTNPRWTAESKIRKGDRIYKPYPNEQYYRDVLGDPSNYGTALK